LIAVDIGQALERPDLESNLLRLNGDTLIVPRISETVRIQGGVQNPSVINFDPRLKHADYISQAGGYAKRALKKSMFVSYANGRTNRTKNYFFLDVSQD